MLAFLDLSPVGENLVALAHKVGAEVASVNARDVDKVGRFPTESIGALADARMLSSFIPVELGGDGATMTDIVAVCYVLGQYCSSTALVFAMHQIQVACLVHHGMESEPLRDHMRAVSNEQRLQASATTEVGTGGDVRSSVCSVVIKGDRYVLRKETPVISYGDYADDILVTARRTIDSPAADQVIVVVRRHRGGRRPVQCHSGVCGRSDVSPIRQEDLRHSNQSQIARIRLSWCDVVDALGR